MEMELNEYKKKLEYYRQRDPMLTSSSLEVRMCVNCVLYIVVHNYRYVTLFVQITACAKIFIMKLSEKIHFTIKLTMTGDNWVMLHCNSVCMSFCSLSCEKFLSVLVSYSNVFVCFYT